MADSRGSKELGYDLESEDSLDSLEIGNPLKRRRLDVGSSHQNRYPVDVDDDDDETLSDSATEDDVLAEDDEYPSEVPRENRDAVGTILDSQLGVSDKTDYEPSTSGRSETASLEDDASGDAVRGGDTAKCSNSMETSSPL